MQDSSVSTEQSTSHAEGAGAETASAGGGEHAADRTRFTGQGAIPPVATGTASGGAAPSASEQGYGLPGKMPAGVDLQSVRASVMIPGGRKLGGGYWQGGSVRTKVPSQVGVEVTHTGVRVYVSPGLYLDADWPLQDCTIDGAGLDFKTKQPYAEVNDVSGLGTGMFSIAGRVGGKITEMIRKATAGTKLVSGDYDPTTDTDLASTMNKVLAGFTGLFEEPDDKKHDAGKPPVTPTEMTQVSAGATIALRDGASFMQSGSGLTIAANGAISLSVDGAGSLGATAGAHDAQGAADAAQIQSVRVDSEALTISVKNKPVAKLESIRLDRGGKVTIERMTPLGNLAGAEGLEAGFSLLAALVAIRGNDPAAGDLYRNSQQPALVDGVTRAMIEQELTTAIHKLVLDNRNAVPGVDLARSLGL